MFDPWFDFWIDKVLSIWSIKEVQEAKEDIDYFKKLLPVELQGVFEDRITEYGCIIQDETLKLGGIIIYE
jgi:hypothetical protein